MIMLAILTYVFNHWFVQGVNLGRISRGGKCEGMIMLAILTYVFNHWFVQGVNLGRISRGVKCEGMIMLAILTYVFSHWFVQGVNPGRISRGVKCEGMIMLLNESQSILCVFSWSFYSLTRSPASWVWQLSQQLSAPSGGGSGWVWGACYTVQSLWYVKAGWPQQVARTGWFALQCILKDLLDATVCLRLSWEMWSITVSPMEPMLVALVREWSHCWRKVEGMFRRNKMTTGR